MYYNIVLHYSLGVVQEKMTLKTVKRKTAIGAFFCTRKIRMETGLIIENGLKLPLKKGFENFQFWGK